MGGLASGTTASSKSASFLKLRGYPILGSGLKVWDGEILTLAFEYVKLSSDSPSSSLSSSQSEGLEDSDEAGASEAASSDDSTRCRPDNIIRILLFRVLYSGPLRRPPFGSFFAREPMALVIV